MMTIAEAYQWCNANPPPGLVQELEEWIKDRPKSVQAILRVLPVACVVTPKENIGIMKPGEYAVVRTYFEDGVHISIMPSKWDDLDERLIVHADMMVAVGFRFGMTPKRVAEILDEKGGDQNENSNHGRGKV